MVLRRPLDAYRSADPPFGDPARAHGTAMQGHYRPLVDAQGATLVVLCAVCRGAGEPWAAVNA